MIPKHFRLFLVSAYQFAFDHIEMPSNKVHARRANGVLTLPLWARE